VIVCLEAINYLFLNAKAINFTKNNNVMAKKNFLIVTFVAALALFFSFNIIANRVQHDYADAIDIIDIDELNANLDGKDSKRQALYSTLTGLLNQGHFSPKKMDDDFSLQVYNKFIDRLDYTKTFFLQSDIDEFSVYKNQIDNQIEQGNSEFYELVSKTYSQRIIEAEAFYKKHIEMPMVFNSSESIELDGKKLNWATSKAELDKRWKTNMTYRLLSRYNELTSAQKEKIKKGELKKEDIKSEADLKKDARKTIRKSMEYYFRRLKKITDKEKFTFYLNAITNNYDPHTTYMAPLDKKRFDEEMSGSFFGIGAVLKMEDNICEISQVMPGAPAFKQGSLKAGDGILKVAQGDEDPVEVVGWDLEDIVKIIRGKKGTTVKLTVRHQDGSEEVIPIVRDKVEIAETFAKSIIIKEKNNKIGYITLPSFYASFNDFDGRRCSTDMKIEIEKLKASKVDGIIIDLRNNGGGSLGDVVDIAGYFIEDGPVVQVKTQNSRAQEMPDRDPSILYNGPLAILINSNSASASEILAAALQDYKRAVILGSTSFGKGTVQRIVNLDSYFKGNKEYKPLGNLKITVQKFYRVNGGATQLKGVEPDIHIPTAYELLDQGERKDENAMPWDQIMSADYKPYGLDFSGLIKKSESRIKANKHFDLIVENAKRIKEQNDNNRYSLNLTQYSKEIEESKKLAEEFEKLEKGKHKLALINLPETTKIIVKDTVEKSKNETWQKAIEKDPYIGEAVNVINDWIASLPIELTKK
jgi:carboxyl-terminal processing protease